MSVAGQVFAPIVRLFSGEYILYSTCSFAQYAAYSENLNYTYGRRFPLASVHLMPKEVEGVPWLTELVMTSKADYAKSPAELPKEAEDRMPEFPEWIHIGDYRIDVSLFNPYAITAYGFQLEVLPVEQKETNLLAKASEQAFAFARKFGFILLDISKPIKVGTDIMPVEWLLDIANSPANFLAEHQEIKHQYVVYNLPKFLPIAGDNKTSRWKTNEEGEEEIDLFEVINEQRQIAISTFHTLFRRGTITLSSEIAVKFSENWELAQEMYAGLYHPVWKNTLITNGSPTSYLLLAKSVYTGKTLGEGVEKGKLEQMPVRQAIQYLSSPLINTSYASALERARSFYSAPPSRAPLYPSFPSTSSLLSSSYSYSTPSIKSCTRCST